VTLPRRLPSSSNTASPSHRVTVNWPVMTDCGPVYDGVGPRTSATGASMLRKLESAGITSIPEMEEARLSHAQHILNNAR